MLTDLTETEELVVAQTVTDVSALDDRAVRAEVLVDLLTEPPDDRRQLRTLKLTGADVTGRLDLEALTLLRPLVLDDCTFTDPIELSETRAPKLALRYCTLPAIRARQLETRGDLDLSGTRTGSIDVNGARIGGTLQLDAAQLGPAEVAFDGGGLDVTGSLNCRGTRFDGIVRLEVAHVGHTAMFSGAHLNAPGRYALSGAGLLVDDDIRCWDRRNGGVTVAGEIVLTGARVGGEVNLTAASLSNPGGAALTCDGARVEGGLFCMGAADGRRFECEGEMRFVSTRIGYVQLHGANLDSGGGEAAFIGDGAVIAGGMAGNLDGQGRRLEVSGAFTLVGTTLTHLDLDGAALRHDDGAALDLSVARLSSYLGVGTLADGPRFEVDGMIALTGTVVGSYVAFSGAHLRNPGARVVRAMNLEVGEFLRLDAYDDERRFEANGAIDLSGARITGELDLEGARLSGSDGRALFAERAEVLGGVRFRSLDDIPFEAEGEIDLSSATVHSKLDFENALCSDVVAHGLRVHGDLVGGVVASGALNLRNAVVDGTVDLQTAEVESVVFERGRCGRLVLPRACAEVDLRDAQVSELHDTPDGYRARVAGFSYKSLGDSSRDLAARLRWLEATDDYVPGAYDQLAAVYRRAGDEDHAKNVLIAKQVRRRKTRRWAGRIAGLAAAPIGYGYRTWRAAAAFVVIILVSWRVFDHAYHHHPTQMVPLKDRPEQLPDFHGLVYALDAMLPVINLGQEAAWTPTGFAQDWYVFSVLSGWVLSLGLIAFLTAWFFRE